MTFHLPPHISFGRIAEHIVLLDAVADRYILLGPKEAVTLETLAAGDAENYDRSVAERLIARGLVAIGAGAAIAAVEAPPVVRSAIETRGEVIRLGLYEVGQARAKAALSLRARGLSGTLSHWRRAGSPIRSGAELAGVAGRETQAEAAALARGFAETRLFIPARRRCVPDSLALLSCLRKRGIAAQLYFGVRIAPFAAHCWVQVGNELLSDPLDIIREFTPVFRL